jgi:hypothetical protein
MEGSSSNVILSRLNRRTGSTTYPPMRGVSDLHSTTNVQRWVRGEVDPSPSVPLNEMGGGLDRQVETATFNVSSSAPMRTLVQGGLDDA